MENKTRDSVCGVAVLFIVPCFFTFVFDNRPLWSCEVPLFELGCATLMHSVDGEKKYQIVEKRPMWFACEPVNSQIRLSICQEIPSQVDAECGK